MVEEMIKCKLTGWYYSHYLHKRQKHNRSAICVLHQKSFQLHESSNTSNLKKHIQLFHTNIKLIERCPRSGKRCYPEEDDEIPGKSQTKQQTPTFSKSPKLLNPCELKKLVAEYIV